MKCPACNETNHAADAIFCHMCGSRLVKRKSKWLLFVLVGLLLAGLYWVLMYSTYIKVSDVVVSDRGGHVAVQIKTDAVFVSAMSSESWLRCDQKGKKLFFAIDENYGAKDRVASVQVYAGLIRSGEATFFIRQNGKGATYLRINPNSFDVFSDKGKTVQVAVATDGDEWNVVSCPAWVNCMTCSNGLTINVEKNYGDYREGYIEVKSYNESARLWIRQQKVSALGPNAHPSVSIKIGGSDTGKRGGSSGSTTIKNLAQKYPTHTYSAQNANTFSSFMVVDKEMGASEANGLLKDYPGWRFESMDELYYIFENYEYALPQINEGYWCYAGSRQGGGYFLNSLAYNQNGERDSDMFRNRVILVK